MTLSSRHVWESVDWLRPVPEQSPVANGITLISFAQSDFISEQSWGGGLGKHSNRKTIS